MIEPDDIKQMFPSTQNLTEPDEEELKRREENLRWLKEHCEWKPLGVEW